MECRRYTTQAYSICIETDLLQSVLSKALTTARMEPTPPDPPQTRCHDIRTQKQSARRSSQTPSCSLCIGRCVVSYVNLADTEAGSSRCRRGDFDRCILYIFYCVTAESPWSYNFAFAVNKLYISVAARAISCANSAFGISVRDVTVYWR